MRDDDSRAWAVRRIEHRLAQATGQTWRVRFRMLLSMAREINDNVIYRGWREEFRDKYLKQRNQYTGELVLAPYIWADLGRREFQGQMVNTAKHKKLIAESLEELNRELRPDKIQIQDTDWWTDWGRIETKSKSNSIRAVSVGGAKEVDIASRQYRERPKPKTWDKENDRRGRVRQYLKDGTVKKFNSAGRPLPSGDMTTVNSLLLKQTARRLSGHGVG